MKKLLVLIFVGFLLFFSGRVLAATPTGFVNDEANVLTAEQKSQLETLAVNFEAQTGNEIAVLITSELKDESIEDMAVRIFEEWGVGKKGEDNGVLILLAVKDREVRIEVGYGLEGDLTDLRSNQIINETMIPALRQGDYFNALLGAMNRIIAVVRGEELSIPSPSPSGFFDGEFVWVYFLIGYLVLGMFSRTRSWWLGGLLGGILGFVWLGFVGAVLFALIGLLIDFVLSAIGAHPIMKRIAKSMGTTHTGGWGGRSGGGFGGFGGGSSGGGGASGKW